MPGRLLDSRAPSRACARARDPGWTVEEFRALEVRTDEVERLRSAWLLKVEI